MRKVVECVPNFSEGRRREIIDGIVAAMREVPGAQVLDVQSDVDHNRSVVTLVGEPQPIVEAAFRGIARAAESIDMNHHRGGHPRMGAVDVIPFIPVKEMDIAECAELSRRVGQRVWREALAEGLLAVFADAGAVISAPTDTSNAFTISALVCAIAASAKGSVATITPLRLNSDRNAESRLFV